MISYHVKAAILALVEADRDATDADRDAVAAALGGRRESDRVVSFRDAAKRTGLHRNTLRKLCRSGRLTGVRGAGSRMIGITDESLARL